MSDFVAGAIIGALLALVGGIWLCEFSHSIGCEERGFFIVDNQKFECKPTGEWVEQ